MTPFSLVFLPDPCTLIDLETTGAHPARDRITEIAVMRIEGGQVVARWETLVNPQCNIPHLIQDLIGITNDMVATAPTFAEVADTLRTYLQGAVFVAHNARFDYGFIRNAYAELGQSFEAPVLCTVKLSRALYPEHHRHGLDALIERHALECHARHRAMGDVEALRAFLLLAQCSFSADTLGRACERAMKASPRPPKLPDGVLEGLPEAPGVYLLYGEEDRLLQLGRASRLRSRVIELLTQPRSKGRVADLASQVSRVEWQETAGELEAALLEQRLLGERRPQYAQAPGGQAFALQFVPGRKRPPVFRRFALQGSDPCSWTHVFGHFRSPRESDAMLRGLANLYGLCPRRLGVEPGGAGQCAAHRAGRCQGVCVGREHFEAHDARLLAALASSALKPWPWPALVVFVERPEHLTEPAFHVFDHWCHLGTVHDEAALQALLAAPPPRSFDADVQRILQRWLAAEPLASRELREAQRPA